MSQSVAVGHRLTPLAVPQITQDEVNAYLVVSGDDNPLHTDRDLAYRAGLANIPVPGMMVMAQMEQFIYSWAPCRNITKLMSRFVVPVLVDGDLGLEGRVVALDADAGQAVLRVTAAQAGKISVIAEAEVTIV